MDEMGTIFFTLLRSKRSRARGELASRSAEGGAEGLGLRAGGAAVYVFPLVRRTGTLRSTAAAIAGTTFARGRSHWQRHEAALKRELAAAGLNKTQIDAELRPYRR